MADGTPICRQKIQRATYSTVPVTLSAYRVLGISTPASAQVKTEMLLKHSKPLTQAVVLFDAFRCSSTLLACFSAGIVGAMVMEKGVAERGTPVELARSLASRLGFKLALGGELHGKPVPGGLVGNSPYDACLCAELENALLHFQSTNFARVFVDMVEFAQRFESKTDIFVTSFPNTVATAVALTDGGYDRIVVASGGFYEGMALEDMILGGQLIDALGAEFNDIDDEAMAMLACSRTFGNKKDVFATTWTAKVLSAINKKADIPDIVAGTRIPRSNWSAMEETVLKVEFVDSTPIIRSMPCRLVFQRPCHP